jgi:hypothetical protein
MILSNRNCNKLSIRNRISNEFEDNYQWHYLDKEKR